MNKFFTPFLAMGVLLGTAAPVMAFSKEKVFEYNHPHAKVIVIGNNQDWDRADTFIQGRIDDPTKKTPFFEESKSGKVYFKPLN